MTQSHKDKFDVLTRLKTTHKFASYEMAFLN